jgi:hypothetical protein
MVLSLTDLGQAVGAPLVSICRRPEHEELWLQPDFGFGTWPETKVNSFIEVQDAAKRVEQSQTWQDKIPRLLWRGAAWVNREYRPELIRIVSLATEGLCRLIRCSPTSTQDGETLPI